MPSDRKYTVKKIDGVIYISVNIEGAFGANPSIRTIADRFKLESDRVLDSLLELPQNRRALEWLYERETIGDENVSVTEMRRQVREAEETPSFTGSGNRIDRRTFRDWTLSIYHVPAIVIPVSERFAVVIERHREEEEISRRIEAETPLLEEIKEEARALHREFIEERKELNKSIEGDIRQYSVASFVKELIEEDEDLRNLLIVKEPMPFNDDIISDWTDAPQRHIDLFNNKVENLTRQSDETCRRLVEYLESEEVIDCLSKRYLISDDQLAKFLCEVTRGIHSVPSGQEYIRRMVREGLLENANQEDNPVWSRLYEPEQNELLTANKSGDAREVFGFLRSTNKAVLEILKLYVHCLEEAQFNELRRTIVEPINALSERRVMSFQLTGKTAQLEIETPQGTTEAYVDVLDVDVDQSGPSRGLERTVKILDIFGKMLDTINAAWVAKQLHEKLDKNEMEWTDVALAINAFTGFGVVSVEIGRASGVINIRQGVMLGLQRAAGIVGGAATAAVGVHDFRKNMDSMEPDQAGADLLMAAGGMLMAGGAATWWLGGVPSILIPIGAVVSLVGAGLKLFLGDSGMERYIKGTQYYPFWNEQDASGRYFLSRYGWELSLETDEGWQRAFFENDEEAMDAKSRFYRIIQVEFAGDHDVDMEIELYDTKGWFSTQLELEGYSVWRISIKHSIGRFQIPVETSVLEEMGHRIFDLEARLYIRENGSREKVCDVPYSHQAS